MATYIVLVRFTEQGIRKIEESTKRAKAFRKQAERLGVEIREQYWTSGAFDGVLVLEAPDTETAAALTLSLGRAGNVQTQTLRAFDRKEFDKVVARLEG